MVPDVIKCKESQGTREPGWHRQLLRRRSLARLPRVCMFACHIEPEVCEPWILRRPDRGSPAVHYCGEAVSVLVSGEGGSLPVWFRRPLTVHGATGSAQEYLTGNGSCDHCFQQASFASRLAAVFGLVLRPIETHPAAYSGCTWTRFRQVRPDPGLGLCRCAVDNGRVGRES